MFWENLFENSFTSASLSTKSLDSSTMYSSSRECFLINKEKDPTQFTLSLFLLNADPIIQFYFYV